MGRLILCSRSLLQSHPRPIPIRELDASGLQGRADGCDCISRNLTPQSLEINDGRQAKARSLGKLRLRQIQESASGATLCGRHLNNFC